MTQHAHITNREIASLDDESVIELCRVLKNRYMKAAREASSLQGSLARAERERKRRIRAKKHARLVDSEPEPCDISSIETNKGS